MRIRGTLTRDYAVEHDVGRLLYGELRPLDEVREVSLEEGEGRARFRLPPEREPGRRRVVTERGEQLLEEDLPLRVVGSPAPARHGNRNAQPSIPGSQQRARQRVERSRFRIEPGLSGDRADLVPQPFEFFGARAPNQGIQTFLDLPAAESAPQEACPRAGRPHVLDEGATS